MYDNIILAGKAIVLHIHLVLAFFTFCCDSFGIGQALFYSQITREDSSGT